MQKINKFQKKLSRINYGWYDKNNHLHKNLKGENFSKNYKMQNIGDIVDNNHGICWELCELEREFFTRENIQFKTIFAVTKHNKHYACHTFLVFKKNDEYYWFESSWNKMKGLKRYENINDIFEDIRNNFDEFTRTKDYEPTKINFYSYSKPKRNITCKAFYRHCMLFGKKIKNPNKLFK